MVQDAPAVSARTKLIMRGILKKRKCRRITLSGKTIEKDFSATEEQEK